MLLWIFFLANCFVIFGGLCFAFDSLGSKVSSFKRTWLSDGRSDSIYRSRDKEDRRQRKEALMDIVQRMLSDMDKINDDDDDDDDDSDKEWDQVFNGVVRIHCTHSEPNFGMPWQRKRQDFSSSTGFMIDDKHILTNAHAVEYGSLIQVKKRQSERKYLSSVVAVGHECDLALLRVEDEDFWTDAVPLVFGDLPDLLEDVSVVGFPVGGDSISISAGVVSRIEMQEYAQASAELLAIQIDAAINPGNSGGPVVDSDRRVVGVAFQSLSAEDTENIGYVVPVTVIRHFLEDVKRHGTYSGVCALGVRLQHMENEMLRKFARLSETDSGVMVLSTAPLSPAASVLKKFDVIMTVAGTRIANDGTISFREGSFNERVQMSYLFTMQFPGEPVELQIMREGQRLTVVVPVWVPQRLVPRSLLQNNVIDAKSNTGTGSKGSIVGGNPSYLVVGGLVFVALNREYMQQTFNVEHMDDFEECANAFRILQLADATPSDVGEEAVLLSQVIANNCNVGYETMQNQLMKTFNGQPIRNLRHLKALVDEAHVEAVRAEAAGDTSFFSSRRHMMVFEFSTGLLIVLDILEAVRAQEQICKEHFIPSACSPDLTRDGK